jgi:hypothetical protein
MFSNKETVVNNDDSRGILTTWSIAGEEYKERCVEGDGYGDIPSP